MDIVGTSHLALVAHQHLSLSFHICILDSYQYDTSVWHLYCGRQKNCNFLLFCYLDY
jgi:hypothetical protein